MPQLSAYLQKTLKKPFYIALVVFVINAVLPSALNGFELLFTSGLYPLWENPVAQEVYEARQRLTEFRRRPLVLLFQQATFQYLGWPHQFSFNAINFVFLTGFFWVMPKLHLAMGQKPEDIPFLQLFLLTSISILFAYLSTICTYDDFVQYFLLASTLFFIHKMKMWHAGLAFFLACICRETSLLYLPILLFLSSKSQQFVTGVTILSTVVLLYVLFLILYLPESVIDDTITFTRTKRIYAWQENFQDWQRAREAITVMILTISIPCLLLFRMRQRLHANKDMIRILLSFILINAIIVLAFTTAREARLFFLPLIFAAPYLARSFRESVSSVWLKLSTQKTIYTVIIASLSIGIAFFWYTPSTYGTGYVFRSYAVFYFGFVLSEFILITNQRDGSC